LPACTGMAGRPKIVEHAVDLSIFVVTKVEIAVTGPVGPCDGPFATRLGTLVRRHRRDLPQAGPGTLQPHRHRISRRATWAFFLPAPEDGEVKSCPLAQDKRTAEKGCKMGSIHLGGEVSGASGCRAKQSGSTPAGPERRRSFNEPAFGQPLLLRPKVSF
jgi:hypothetical protein